ncbi:MFS transporter [Natranaerobius trueperi]|uniref:MFS transporter n=1 Tax=Natranaerobius trueperi TaxID=759412 RepID=A0A226BZI9_9FIRM|nr:MFS transporter [Natranaerobius trueperi]OWZ84355.1 MFS transporter [Natranaerobius trueperi]
MQTTKEKVPTYLISLILIMGAFGVMGGGLVAPALPSIGRAFDIPESQQGFILSVYTLSAAISLPFLGYLIDIIGRRKIGLASLIIDGVAGISIIFAPSFSAVLILRFIQGIGIAGLIPIAMTIIGDLFTGDRRLQLMGYLTGIISLGAAVIPTLGGSLATIDWRLVFLVYSLPLILAIFFYFGLPETAPPGSIEKAKKISPLQYVISLFTVLKNRGIRNVMFHSLTTYFFLYSLVTFLPIYIVTVHGFTEIFSGLALSLQGASSALVASKANILSSLIKWRYRTAIGFIFKGLAFILLPFWPTGSFLISISLIFYGIGYGIVSPTIYNRATTLPPKELSGSVIAIFNTMKFIGMTLSPFILGIVLNFTDVQIVFSLVALIAILWGVFVFVARDN